jgi:phosphatidate cytidylyltransferase
MIVLGIFQSKKIKTKIKNISAAGLGLVYISLSWALMISLYLTQVIKSTQIQPNSNPQIEVIHNISKPWIIPLAIISSIWINDTMAYIVGSIIGKTQLSTISPKKTWEGTMGRQ